MFDKLLCFAGINESYQIGLFQVLAAILHLGNVEIKDKDSDSSLIAVRIIVLFLSALVLSFGYIFP